MSDSSWFSRQLQSTADGLVWSARQVPEARQYLAPPAFLGEWSAARHLFHMLYYEQNYALPSMRQWLGEPGLSRQALEKLNENTAWSDTLEYNILLGRFQDIRQAQIALLPRFEPAAWQESRACVWGAVTLHWLVSKTYQHTVEHTSELLRIALFWDMAVAPALPPM
jgi:hypothetical protein